MEYKWTVLTVTTIGVLMSGIDSRILIVGLPQVAAALNANAEQAIWLTQGYVLGGTIVMLLIGRLTDMFGRVKIYIIGFALFTIGSLLTSISLNATEAIIFRGVQGFASGILQVNSAALITDATPVNELGFVLGVNFSAFRFGSVFGLTISGLILSFLDWRALFYINIPIGIFGTWWARRRLKDVVKLESNTKLDWLGFIAFTTSITCFLLALTLAAYGMSEMTTVYILLTVAVVTIVAFTFREMHVKQPLLDLRLLKIREFTGGVVAQLLNQIAFGGVMILISLYLQLVVGLSPFDAGIKLIPFEVAMLPFSILGGRLSDRYGTAPLITGGLGLTSISLLLLSTVDASTPYLSLLIFMVLLGIGIGLFGAPNMSSVMGAVPAERRGVASGFRTVMMNIGYTMSLNLAILIMTFTLPLTVISQIITSANSAYISGIDSLLFIQGLQRTYVWLAVLNTIAIIPSILRGKRTNPSTQLPKDNSLTEL